MEERLPFGNQAHQTFIEVEDSGRPARPLEFPAPEVKRAIRGQALVVHVETGRRQVLRGIIYRDPLSFNSHSSSSSSAAARTSSSSTSRSSGPKYAYYPQKQLQECIYGSVWACLVLRRHYSEITKETAIAAGVDPDDPNAPIVWEITNLHVAIKMMVWSRIHRNRGKLLEDPVKEIAAMQLIGNHPHVLGCKEVLEDDDFLYCVMPYCSGGDLFGVVVRYTEESGGEIGMPEPVARFWFRQILMGLNYLQSKGVCHRDLSLENILVNRDKCLIIDFGMCLRVPYSDPLNRGATTDVISGSGLRRLIVPQGTCGKHNYMSPEIFANREPFDGFAIDVWAAGVILYIMLTGFPPYDQAMETDPRFEAIISGNLVSQLKEWDVNLSSEAGHLLQSMLVLDPRNRMTLAQVRNHPWVVEGETRGPASRNPPWQQHRS